MITLPPSKSCKPWFVCCLLSLGLLVCPTPGLSFQDEPEAPPAADTTESAPETAETPETEKTEPAPQEIVLQAPVDTRLQPYRVRVDLIIEDQFLSLETDSLQQSVEKSLNLSWGALFEANIQLTRSASIPSESVRLNQFQLDNELEELDKLFLIAVRRSGNGIICSAAEYDLLTENLTPVVTVPVPNLSETHTQVIQAMHRVFRPVAHLKQNLIKEKRLVAELVAGDLMTTDPQFVQADDRSYFRPYLILTQKGNEQIIPIPWTWIEIDELNRWELRGHVHSALAQPIPSLKRKNRVVLLAVKQFSDTTTITFLRRPPSLRPCVAMHAEWSQQNDRAVPADEATHLFEQGLTNRLGQMTFHTAARKAGPEDNGIFLDWVRLVNGDHLLTLVPIIMGADPEVELTVPSDSVLLAMEGDMLRFDERLTTLLAQRVILVKSIQQAVDKEQWDTADQLMLEWEEIPSEAELKQQIRQIQVTRIEQAIESRERSSRSRINLLTDKMTKKIGKYFSNKQFKQFTEDIAQLKELMSRQ